MPTFFEGLQKTSKLGAFFGQNCQALMLEEFWKNNRASQLEILKSSFFLARKTATFFLSKWPMAIRKYCMTYVHHFISSFCGGDGIAFGLGFWMSFVLRCFECQQMWQNEGVWKF